MKHLEYLIVGMLVTALAVGSFIFIPYVIGTGLMRIKFMKEFENSCMDPAGERWFIGICVLLVIGGLYALGMVFS